jgi:hypothetical protein
VIDDVAVEGEVDGSGPVLEEDAVVGRLEDLVIAPGDVLIGGIGVEE